MSGGDETAERAEGAEGEGGEHRRLLAVDLGLRTGLALFGGDGRLIWYRSHNLGTVARLKRAVPSLLRLDDAGAPPDQLVLEGPRNLADVWTRVAEKRGIPARVIGAETWRPVLLHSRQQRSGKDAKRSADDLARRVIRWSGAPGPTSLRHDAAEAILVGLWGVLQMGWLEALPGELRVKS